MNSCDGQGLVSPEMAQKWSQEMNLGYVASSYVVRSIFVKGNLVPFDFHAYAKENGIEYIYDKWGHPYKVNEIDVLLSESQFKMHKYYSSWEDYSEYIEMAQIGWGVSRYNRKFDDEWLVNTSTALIAVIIMNCWVGIPFNMLLLVSGLTSISPDVYESASMDGANETRKKAAAVLSAIAIAHGKSLKEVL